MRSPGPLSFDFASLFTPLVRNVFIVLGAIYAVELIGGSALTALGALMPFGASWQPWQPFTFPFVHGPPDVALWTFLGLFFFLQAVVSAMGRRRFWWSTVAVWFAAVAGKIGVEALGVLPAAPVFGIGWWCVALTVWFGLFNRGAQILLAFVIPVRADWVAWGTGLVCLVRFVYYKDTGSLFYLLAFGVAVALVYVDADGFRRWRLLRRKAKIERDLSKFQVIDGGKDRPRRTDSRDWVN
jgi:hypothetical protein